MGRRDDTILEIAWRKLEEQLLRLPIRSLVRSKEQKARIAHRLGEMSALDGGSVDDTFETGILTAEGDLVKGGEIEGETVVGGSVRRYD